MTSLESFI